MVCVKEGHKEARQKKTRDREKRHDERPKRYESAATREKQLETYSQRDRKEKRDDGYRRQKETRSLMTIVDD